ncbi:MAG: arylsulfatase [Bacteroidetes bacterium]|jgi:arylsulfatase A-like enzyme|nr:arylsulfatase [Bacteroidota bacterium]MBT4398700.1 arylsulfatase [Bacteroidota bacterium]MBT4412335.1 arylsulfatase [Bacteroidota bacterium]MBT7094802.1 arylsulfatase [Bacteroidota bacterium]MBT7465444.1 arylsulfatase [Bacteroidota bacterium]
MLRFVKGFAILLTVGITACNTVDPPNIIVILADDLGYGELSSYGSTELNTPGIDQLATDGIRFTQGYCTSATCTPSRYGILTGEYPWKNERARILRGDAPLILKPGMLTLPSILNEAGYTTAVIGKWHLGLGNGNVNWNERVSPGPAEVGFDYSYILAATQDRTPTVLLENQKVIGLSQNDPLEVSYKNNFEGEPTGKNNPEMLKMHPSHGHNQSITNGISRIGYQRGGKSAMWIDEDLADTFTNVAVNFIRENKENPFFIYFTLHQPHVPRTPHARFVGKSGMGPRGDVILEADWSVGKLIEAIEEEGLREKTLIVFSSDNGPVLDDGYHDQAVELIGDHNVLGALRGGKYSLFDGGTRVPFLVSWPGTIKPGVSEALVCQLDLAASIASLVGVEIGDGAPDSQDVMKALMGKAKSGRDELFVEAGSKVALRKGDWFYIPPYKGAAIHGSVNIESGCSTVDQLYSISKDIGQKNNLAKDYPEVLKEMKAYYAEHKKNPKK